MNRNDGFSFLELLFLQFIFLEIASSLLLWLFAFHLYFKILFQVIYFITEGNLFVNEDIFLIRTRLLNYEFPVSSQLCHEFIRLS